MKKLDVVVVRFLPILLFADILVVLVRCMRGVDVTPFSYLHSNSFFYALALYLISSQSKRYHCVWNRAMYIELMIIPLVNYIDAKFCVFADTYSLLIALGVTWIVALIATIILALRHFLKPRILKCISKAKKI